MDMISYERMKDSVVFGLEEYIDEGLNVAQASAKILEEEWRRVNISSYTKAVYFITMAKESMELNEIADFVLSKATYYLDNKDYENKADKNELGQLRQDIIEFKQLLDKNQHRVLETDHATKARIKYILELKVS